MRSLLQKSPLSHRAIIASSCLMVLFFGIVTASKAQAASNIPVAGERLITIHDNGQDRGILTRDTTLRQVFKDANIPVDPNDLIEPGLDETLVATSYEVNVYRARPVTIIDGAIRTKVMSAYQTPEEITAHAGVMLRAEDITNMSANTDMVADGAGVSLAIDRATQVSLVLYGTKTTVYTQAKTVGEMLQQKHITIGKDDTLSIAPGTLITTDVSVELWRNGTQTATEQQPIAFDVQKIEDADHDVGYKEVKTPGTNGMKSVSYEIVMKNGVEVSRQQIQSVTTLAPVSEVDIIGTKVSLPPGSHQDWMAAAGMDPANYGYINYIFTGESHWNPAAVNSAGYSGLGQTNKSSLINACGATWASDPICQIGVFNGYAVSRYGSWANAAAHWQQNRSW